MSNSFYVLSNINVKLALLLPHHKKLKNKIMKKLILSSLMFLSVILINAQTVKSMADEEFSFSSGKKEVIKVAFEDVSAKNLEAAFVEYFKKNYKAKVSAVKKTDGEFEISEFKATDIQQKMTSGLAVITELEGNAILYIHYKSEGYVVSLKNTPEIYPGYKKMTQKTIQKAVQKHHKI